MRRQLLAYRGFSCLISNVAQRSARRAGVQRRGHSRPAHARHCRGGLPRLPRHRAVHHPRDPREGAGAERGVRQHRLRHHRPVPPQVHGAGKLAILVFLFLFLGGQSDERSKPCVRF